MMAAHKAGPQWNVSPSPSTTNWPGSSTVYGFIAAKGYGNRSEAVGNFEHPCLAYHCPPLDLALQMAVVDGDRTVLQLPRQRAIVPVGHEPAPQLHPMLQLVPEGLGEALTLRPTLLTAEVLELGFDAIVAREAANRLYAHHAGAAGRQLLEVAGRVHKAGGATAVRKVRIDYGLVGAVTVGHPTAAGRLYAAYYGVYLGVAVVWLMLVDGVRLSTSDWVGVVVSLVETAIIMFWALQRVTPRRLGAPDQEVFAGR